MLEHRNLFEKLKINEHLINFNLSKNYDIWSENIEIINSIIKTSSTSKEAFQKYYTKIMYSFYEPEKQMLHLESIEWLKYFQKNINLSDNNFLYQESDLIPETYTVKINNNLFSSNLFIKIQNLLDLNKCENINKSKPTFFEIGGGFGSLARLLKIKFNNAKIFNIDLVESLQFYYIFIKYNFPKANILFVKNPEDIDHINNNYDFILIPNYFLDILINNENFKLINIDILINTRSFGEMNNEITKKYFVFIDSLKNLKYIFLHNRFLNFFNPNIDSARLLQNRGFLNLSCKWKTIYYNIDPSFTKFPYHEILNPREMVFIGENLSTQSNNVIHYKKIKNYYFIKNFSLLRNQTGGAGRVDLTYLYQELFELFEINRINPTVETLDIIIKLLYLCENTSFHIEERYYYMEKYKEKSGKKHITDYKNKIIFLHLTYYMKIKLKILAKKIMGRILYNFLKRLIIKHEENIK